MALLSLGCQCTPEFPRPHPPPTQRLHAWARARKAEGPFQPVLPKHCGGLLVSLHGDGPSAGRGGGSVCTRHPQVPIRPQDTTGNRLALPGCHSQCHSRETTATAGPPHSSLPVLPGAQVNTSGVSLPPNTWLPETQSPRWLHLQIHLESNDILLPGSTPMPSATPPPQLSPSLLSSPLPSLSFFSFFCLTL